MLNLFRLEALRRIRLSSTDSQVIEVECEVTRVSLLGEQEFMWLPINEIAVVPIGTLMTDGEFNEVPRPRTHQRVKAFRTDRLIDLLVSHPAAIETPNGRVMTAQSASKLPCYVQQDGPLPVAVPAMELTRFYLAAASVAVDNIMRFDVDPEAVFDSYCDLSRTGYLDTARREFRIAPKPGLCDRGAALQIAQFLTDEPLQTTMAGLARGIRRSAASGGDVEMPLVRSPAPLDLKFVIADQEDGRLFRQKGHVMAERVVSDYRKPAFERLVVELPVGYDKAAFNDPGRVPATDPRPPIDPDATETRERKPGTRSLKSVSAQGGIAQAFPFLNGVKTQYEERTRVPPPLPRPPEPPPPPIKEYSSLPRGGREPVARLNVVPRSDPEPQIERSTLDDQRFAETDPACQPSLVTVDVRGLDARMGRFASAGSALASDALVDLAGSSLAGGGQHALRVFELARACGAWAWSTRRGRGRYVAFLPLLVGRQTVWAVSIERKAERHLPMGLFVAREPVAELDFAARTLAALARRNSHSSEDAGTFPDQDYADVRFASLIHSANRQKRVSTLAIDLFDRAVALAKREGGYDPDAV